MLCFDIVFLCLILFFIIMNRKLKVKLRKFRYFFCFLLLQCLVLYMGIFPWTTLGRAATKLIDLCQSCDLFYIPDLMLIVWQIILIVVTVVFGVIGTAILLFEIGALVLDLFRVVRSENKKEALQRFSRFYKAIIFG